MLQEVEYTREQYRDAHFMLADIVKDNDNYTFQYKGEDITETLRVAMAATSKMYIEEMVDDPDFYEQHCEWIEKERKRKKSIEEQAQKNEKKKKSLEDRVQELEDKTPSIIPMPYPVYPYVAPSPWWGIEPPYWLPQKNPHITWTCDNTSGKPLTGMSQTISSTVQM